MCELIPAHSTKDLKLDLKHANCIDSTILLTPIKRSPSELEKWLSGSEHRLRLYMTWFNSQHPQGSLQLPVTPVSGDPKQTCAWCIYQCMQAIPTLLFALANKQKRSFKQKLNRVDTLNNITYQMDLTGVYRTPHPNTNE